MMNRFLSIAGLSDGFHDMYIRVFDQAANNGLGAWSHYDKSTFYVKSFGMNMRTKLAKVVF